MNAVIYARFSSHSQTEQSIEGQLKVCHEYAKNYGLVIVGEYIDRAMSGTNDNRPQFQKMIADSSKRLFEIVLVYQLDRFARNRYDSATNRAKLKKNGVKVVSAKENISDDPSGVLMEALLEGMAEYYSAELSQKVRRGMAINAQKGLMNGGRPPFGYKVANKQLCIDEVQASYVLKAFQMYANGCTIKSIADYLNSYQFKTSAGKSFGRTSLQPLLHNQKYIGLYCSQGVEIPDGIPRIVPDKLFYEVQAMLEKNKRAPARAKAKEEYLLTTKLFCGKCREPMVGYSGTSGSGATYHYYVCMGRKRKICDKKHVQKKAIEDSVVLSCRATLTDENIVSIVTDMMKYQEKIKDASNLKQLRKSLVDNERRNKNLVAAVMDCDNDFARKSLYSQFPTLEEEHNNIVQQITAEELALPDIEEKTVTFFLKGLQKGDVNDPLYRRTLVNILVNRIYLFEDKYTIYFNTDKEPVNITVELAEAIEAADCSFMDVSPRPHQKRTCRSKSFFDVVDAYGRVIRSLSSLKVWYEPTVHPHTPTPFHKHRFSASLLTNQDTSVTYNLAYLAEL